MAPIAVTPDSSTASPSGDSWNSYLHVCNGDSHNIISNNGHDHGEYALSAAVENGHGSWTAEPGIGLSSPLPPPGHLQDMPIAIVGMACRMPGNVSTPAEFWELCTRARSGWSETPKQRFNSARFHHPNQGKGGTLNPVGGNFLNVDLAAFDAPFFGLTEKEAISMDPQQRLLLECTFEALENAGIPKHSIAGKDVGVFVGGSFPEYESHLFRDPDTIPMHQATGCAYAMQSNRISHFFDLRGPSFTADTACSSSMVAIHLACQSLRTGESSAALVGGCHLNMLPEFWISFSTCRLLSDAGRLFSFDNRSTGFSRGEGCGIIVLKPPDQAIKDKDPIRAVITATSLNQDGKTPGITVPHRRAQEDLIRKVYGRASLDPNLCGFVEAHRTGTRVGDPIEATAIHNVLSQDRSPRNPLLIGSVKSNIGHLEGAFGIASVIKAALILERSFILPNHDFKQPNPRIPWKEWNLEVPVTQRPVNNFGFGSTNCHVVLTAAPFLRSRTSGSSHNDILMASDKSGLGRKLYITTAHDNAALSQQMKNIVVYLEQRPEIFQVDLTSNLAYTLGQRRSLLQWRAAIPAINSFKLIEAINGEKAITGKETEPFRLSFIFTGQGAQWYAMGRELYEQYPTFSTTEWSLVEELGRDAKTSRISEAHISQPLCTAVQLALPTAIAAVYAAGIIDFESAMYPELQGRMMAVGGRLQAKKVRIACYNSPSSLTISGDEPALAELERICEKRQLFNRRLVVDVAYHSHHMNLVAKDYPRTDVQFHSSLTDLQPNYWVDNLTCPSMLAPVGKHKYGVNMLQVLKEVGGSAPKIAYASVLARKRNALFTRGANLDFGAVNFPKTTKPPTLLTDSPRYPWNHSTRYWQESRMTDMHKNAVGSRSDIIEPTWRNIVRLDDLPWLRYYKIQSLIIYPMSAFLAMAMEAASQRAKSKHCSFDRFQMRDIAIKKPLAIPNNDIEEGWIEHCVDHLHSVAPTIDNAQWASIDPQHMYETLNKLGVVYGPAFQGLDNINMYLVAPDVAKEMLGGYLTEASLIGMYWLVLGAGCRITKLASEPGNTLRAICKGEVDPGIYRPFKVHMSIIAIDGLTVSPLPVGAQIVIIHEDSNFQLLVALRLANALEQATGRLPEVGKLDTVDAKGKTCIFLNELLRPLLATLSPSQFSSLQKLLTGVEAILWVVKGAYDKCTEPEAYMVTGLSRSIRSETALRFATLDLDAASPLSEAKAAEMVFCVFKMAFGSASSSMSELEFMERKGSLFTPRITHDRETDQEVQNLTNPRALEPTTFGDDGRFLRLEISAPGALHTLHFVDDHSLEVPLAIDQLEIEVKAVGLNFRDAMATKGQIPITMSGAEASGIVVAVGSSICAFKVGDRVAALTQGAFATRTRATASLAIKVPGHISFEAAATLPLGYCAAYYSLVDVGRLAEGETVLIHQAAGAVGQAAICLAQVIGAEIFATVGSAEKKELLINEFGLPSDYVLYSRDTSFGPTIRRATYGKGVDVIFNSLVGDGLRESWESLGKFGRLVDIGKRDSASKSRTEVSAAKRNASFVSVDIFALLAERPKVLKRVFADVARLLRYGKVRSASPLFVFPVSDIEGALKMQQSGSTMGKAVVALSGSDFVKAPPSRRSKDLLHSDATYILVGGTGGLGRSIARWMAGKGAQNIVLVSRSASLTGKTSMLGVSVHVRRCNVVNETEVDGLIRTGLQGLPPIRGVVLGTMVLHDVLFEKMTWTDYTEVIKAGAVGNRGQAAYSAANCFLNSLVQYRLTHGLPGSSLDLTAVSDSGYLAEDPEKAAEVARNLGSDTICEAEVLALLYAAISGKLTLACNNHTITGMRITSTMRPFWTDDAKFKAMRMAAEDEAAKNASLNMVVLFSATLKNAKSLTEAEDVVCKGLVEKISSVLMLDAEDMDITRSLSHYPLDSLVAIEIRNFITRDFEANLQVLELLSSGSIQTLAKAVCANSKIVSFQG
ncbi:polyketide synthase [Neurospora intermedia]|uniref:Polyketide synthase n=1 Tax=Neurospora intermedia TaxID=5142 RepID=A0ABR3D4V6_NEUIN